MEKCAAYNTVAKSIGRVPCFHSFVVLSVFECGLFYMQQRMELRIKVRFQNFTK